VYLIQGTFRVKDGAPGTAPTVLVQTFRDQTTINGYTVAGTKQTLQFSIVETCLMVNGVIRIAIRPEGGTLVLSSGRLTVTRIT
jgi:hypothetical protein